MGDFLKLVLMLVFASHILAWVISFILSQMMEKFEENVRAKTPQPEYHLIKWEEFPEYTNLEKLRGYSFSWIFMTGPLLIIVAVVLGLTDMSPQCSNRFEDYC